jgi:hypothetical protein
MRAGVTGTFLGIFGDLILGKTCNILKELAIPAVLETATYCLEGLNGANLYSIKTHFSSERVSS